MRKRRLGKGFARQNKPQAAHHSLGAFAALVDSAQVSDQGQIGQSQKGECKSVGGFHVFIPSWGREFAQDCW
ncbi:MAG: hypothetical protein ABSC23_07330 [Bryobacteraceae bacterium]